MRRKVVFSTIIAALMIFSPLLFAQVLFAQASSPKEHRIIEPITVNGDPAMGILVVENGITKTYSCASPQPYVTENRSESGWACFDQASGMWLLHAKPPSQVMNPAPQEAPIIINTAPDTLYGPSYDYSYSYPYYPYGYYPYSYYYPYRYYPYSYYGPYFWGPQYGLGFSFNFGHGGFHGHDFHGGRGFGRGGGFSHGGGGLRGGGSHGGFGHMGGGRR